MRYANSKFKIQNSKFLSLTLLLFSLFHAAAFAAADNGATEIYTPSEKKRLTSSKSLEDKIRVYDAAFARIRKELEKNTREDRFDAVSRTLQSWSALLKESLADIEANANPKKKSNRLKKYEINLRQTINGLRAIRLRLPVELHDALISFAEQMEETRNKFMNILFGM